MKLRKLIDAIGAGEDAVIKAVSSVGCWLVFVMALVLTVNVLGRFLFSKPVLGTIEIVELLLIIIAALSVPYTAMKRGHVRVDVLLPHFSRRTQAILASLAFFISAGISAIIAYQAILDTIYYAQHLGQHTATLSIPFAPLRGMLALGFILLCLKTLVDVFHPLPPEEGDKGGLNK